MLSDAPPTYLDFEQKAGPNVVKLEYKASWQPSIMTRSTRENWTSYDQFSLLEDSEDSSEVEGYEEIM
eukprot:13476235-Heterocapsa_arctica.AAC.1